MRLSTAIDRLISFFSPSLAVERLRARREYAILSATRSESRTRLDSSGPAPYYFRPDYSTIERARVSRRVFERNDARALARENVIAESLVNAQVDNVVGPGISVRSLCPNREVAKRVDEVFSEWSETCGLQGQSLAELQEGLFRSAYVDGDAFLHLLEGPKVELITGDIVRGFGVSDPLDSSLKMVDGVTIDENVCPVRYWLDSPDPNKPSAVPAEEIVPFVFRRLHERDVRGTPAFRTNYNEIHQLNEYVEATVVAARVAACFGLVITTTTAPRVRTPAEDDDSPLERIQPGMIQRLRSGETIQQITPAHPTTSFPQHVTAMLRLIGLPDRMPLEVIALDFSTSNFSAQRAAIHQWRKALRRPLRRFIASLKILYRWAVRELSHKGGPLASVADEPGLFEHRWTPPSWGYLDPSVEAHADGLRIALGIASLRDVHEQNGTDYVETLHEIAQEQALASELGAVLCRPSSVVPVAQGAIPKGRR